MKIGLIGFGKTGKGYFTCFDSALCDYSKVLIEYNPETNDWTRKADFGGVSRTSAAAFVIDGIAYVGSGYSMSGGMRTDFWKYDPVADSWSPIANIPGLGTSWSSTFALNGEGYVVGGAHYNSGTGTADTWYNEVWMYSPSTNTWTTMNPMPCKISASYAATANNKAYLAPGLIYTGAGNPYTLPNYMWEYDPSLDSWTQTPAYDGVGVYYGVSFSIGDKIYIVGGAGEAEVNNKTRQYDPQNQTWTEMAMMPVEQCWTATSFAIGGKGYVAGGSYTPHLWVYSPIDAGVNELLELNLGFYPNPFSGSTTLRFDKPVVNGTIALFDAAGKLVFEMANVSGSEVLIQKENLSAGIYRVHYSESGALRAVGKLTVID